MSVKSLLERVDEEVKDVLSTGFEYSGATSVPNYDYQGLTYESGETKKGKEFETCVLYADIRDSVKLNESYSTKTMGQLYTAFTKAVLRAAAYHDGSVRNIIGDRVMVIFPPNSCFKNAVDCAVSINHISSKIIDSKFSFNFKCGIGIDYGPTKVLKVGIERRGKENQDNKNLVWVGKPANLASRLTDVANKTVEEEYYEVRRNPLNPRAFQNLGLYRFSLLDSFNRSMNPDLFGYDPNASLYLKSVQTVELSPKEFANSIVKNDHNKSLFHSGGNLIDFQKKTRKYTYKPILITEEVLKGLKKEDPNRNSLNENLWEEENQKIDSIKSLVFGSNLTWII